MKKLAVVVSGLILALATPAFAQDPAPATASNPTTTPLVSVGTHQVKRHIKYGTAGCGLGSILFGSKPGIVQIFAATTNGTSGNQTFGITTGTSNCDDADEGEDSAQVFIHANREALAKDMSRGGGETIANLSTISGCTNPSDVGRVLQAHYKSIFPNAAVSSDVVTDSIISTLQSDKTLSCSKLSS